ncbi:unnamed protein product, partial [Aphanomyces euteiches]
ASILLASEEGHVDIVQELLNHGASIDVQNLDGDTSIILAAKTRNLKLVKTLVKAGANLSVANKEGKTVRDIANISVRILLKTPQN